MMILAAVFSIYIFMSILVNGFFSLETLQIAIISVALFSVYIGLRTFTMKIIYRYR